MTIEEYKKALSKLDIIELEGLKYLWKCPHCGKEMILTTEQVRPMIYKENTLVLCNECDKLALFVVKRNGKFLWIDKSENDKKRWSNIGYATIFTKEQIKEYKDKFEIVQISHPIQKLINDYAEKYDKMFNPIVEHYEEVINQLIDELIDKEV